MTNNQLTKEWLQQTIAELESVRDEIPFGIDTNSELELAAFRLALAAMDSEPVEPIWGAKKYPVSRPVPGAKLIIWDETGKFVGYGSAVVMRESGVAIQLSDGRRLDSNHELRWQYALQPAPVVPEEMTPQQASRSYGGEVRGYRDGWNACRAAMLAAAPQSHGSEPATVPDKWIPVSERLPEEGGRYWCYVEE